MHFCDKPQSGDDAAHLIIARAPRCFVMLNLYPYNNGHLLVAPFRHVARLEELEDDECGEIMAVTRRAVKVTQQAFNAEGFNIGMNVGRVAGAALTLICICTSCRAGAETPTSCPL
jgi:ATP adenylyltransferase